MVTKHTLFLPFLLLSVGVSAQVCFSDAANPVGFVDPSERFEINETDGIVLDRSTGLMWQQCEVGLNYNADNKTCIGSTQKLTWQQALLEANDNSHAGFTDWHVPNIKELASIIDHSCVSPALPQLELGVFLFSNELISGEEGDYWSSTTVTLEPQYAWTFQVSDGKNRYLKKTQTGRLRLVRYAK
ncbi:DUF1566 domain-containing protein [Pseudoalteromonas sp. SS15]|uniref:Lcl C-terminal domain-containing protein n=1 Tax=Pseudoalteromonas sp. SS15 TaxID=3139393 RepID=UPI003BAB7F1C